MPLAAGRGTQQQAARKAHCPPDAAVALHPVEAGTTHLLVGCVAVHDAVHLDLQASGHGSRLLHVMAGGCTTGQGEHTGSEKGGVFTGVAPTSILSMWIDTCL